MVARGGTAGHALVSLPRRAENGLLKLARLAYDGAGSLRYAIDRTIIAFAVPVAGRVPVRSPTWMSGDVDVIVCINWSAVKE